MVRVLNVSAGSGCPGSSLDLSEERVRHLLEFYVDLALFLLWFNLVTCHSDLIARCPYIQTAYLPSIIQQLDHIALGHYTQLMCDTGSLDFQVTTGPRVRQFFSP